MTKVNKKSLCRDSRVIRSGIGRSFLTRWGEYFVNVMSGICGEVLETVQYKRASEGLSSLKVFALNA